MTHPDGTTERVSYACCGLDSQTDREGVTTTYTYDAAKRQVATTRLNITTTNVLDAAGRVLKTIRIGTDSSQITLRAGSYGTDGRLMRYDVFFPLTPALSPGERENLPPALDNSKRDDCRMILGKPLSARMLFTLPKGEGQGEGEPDQLPPARLRTTQTTEWGVSAKGMTDRTKR